MVKVAQSYDLSIEYHSGRANVVADALSRKVAVELRAMFARLSISRDGGLVAELQVKPTLIQLIQEKQLQDSAMAAHVPDIAEGKPTDFRFRDEGVLCFKDRTVVPDDGELRQTILTEAHSSPFSMHLVCEQMYGLSESEGRTSVSVGVVATLEDSIMEMREDHYGFCNGIAVDTFEEELCMGYSGPIHPVFQVYREILGVFAYGLGFSIEFQHFISHQIDGQSERVIQVLEDMLRCCIIDFQGTWERNNCHWLSLRTTTVTKLVFRWHPMKPCMVGGVGHQCVGPRQGRNFSSWKKVMRFGRKGKLSSRFIGPYEIVERVGPVAYRLLLPPELERIHDVFHVSMLRRYRSDPSHVMPVKKIDLNPNLLYDEEPAEILASDSKYCVNQGNRFGRSEMRYWKLREGENRLSVLLQRVTVSGNDFNGRAAILMMFGGLD
ncbi:hypothetical protein GQ457_07G006230 [Hibiscus cannabinus]